MSGGSEPAPSKLLERVELGRPAGLWEGHLADGRADAMRRLLSWMEPLRGLEVLDAGCGHGTVAVELARRGAHVLACDRDLGRARSAASRARSGAPRAHAAGAGLAVIVADLAAAAPWGDGPTTWLCWELFEHLSIEQRRGLLRVMEESRASALFFAARVESRLGALVAPLLDSSKRGAGEHASPLPTLDPVLLLREIHLETDLRLERTETLTRRNGALALAQMRRP
ncbi:MAG TPA: methyltransferase domain-containing protein [Thermoanaerobaculia bacterium]|nr:methyltransferase domain-containing protein [Thermoanaerobaculia bacterium]